ncbi:DNA-binding transcriptional repressor DeoR [Photobacterium nomapromontoriensis]|uniref:DNA-binding transcriptional repressor DeoR n=1 Tax=Photobacterium nomapromontoriensis TaxID=2910237 RepID=UPI003D0AB014
MTMTETKRDKRVRQLAELLHGQEKIHLKDAADSLCVSEMTLRRDLSEPHPTLSVIGGYIINKQAQTREYDYIINEQNSNNVSEKSALGKIAAKKVKQNDVVFFDNGTTIVHIIHAIDDEINFIGVCCSLNVFLALNNKPNCNAILCGGHFDPKCNHFYPLTESNELANIRFDLMFASAAGIDDQQGITCHALTEIAYKRRAMKQSQYIMLVVDSSKMSKVRKAFVCDIADMDEILCDVDLPLTWKRQIKHKKRG